MFGDLSQVGLSIAFLQVRRQPQQLFLMHLENIPDLLTSKMLFVFCLPLLLSGEGIVCIVFAVLTPTFLVATRQYVWYLSRSHGHNLYRTRFTHKVPFFHQGPCAIGKSSADTTHFICFAWAPL